MRSDILTVLCTTFYDSFLAVTVFVGAVMVLLYADCRHHNRIKSLFIKYKNFQPIFGALLGLMPGCGGAIMVMPLFLSGTVTFGTVIAALIATAGDSAFVILTQLPKQFLVMSGICFIVAITTGYLIDSLKIGSKLYQKFTLRTTKDSNGIFCETYGCLENEHIPQDSKVMHAAFSILRLYSCFFMCVVFVGLILGIMALFQVDINALAVPYLGYIVGGVGTFSCLFIMLLTRNISRKYCRSSAIPALHRGIIKCSRQTAFIGMWVFFAFLIYGAAILVAGRGDYVQGEIILTRFMQSAGLLSVLLGAVIGLIPGCGAHIIFATLFAKGLLPFAALIANAISQDGDALIPLIAMDARSSCWATVITTIPAVMIGFLIYYIEMHMGVGTMFDAMVANIAALLFG